MEMVSDKLVVALVGGWNDMERKKEGGELFGKEKTERGLFWPTLDPIFLMLKPRNPTIFVGGGRGQSCLY